MKPVPCKHHARLDQLFVVGAHLSKNFLVRKNARFRLLFCFYDDHNSHCLISYSQTSGSPLTGTTGRISTVPQRPAGIRPAISMASSRFPASIRKKPPSCSRVSANGPSVMSGLPSRTRTLVAVEVGCNGAV